MMRAIDRSWGKIFLDYDIQNHDFDNNPFYITAKQIKVACQNLTETGEKEPRILCKQDTREKRPQVFIDNNLFLLPVRNGKYAIIKGEGYIDIPSIDKSVSIYNSQLDFPLDTSFIGNSEMQHLDFAYAASLIRTFMVVVTKLIVLQVINRIWLSRFNY